MLAPAHPECAIPVVILCGGRGTRAHPLTEEVPKPLLCVGGRPVVEHVMAGFARRGYHRFVLALGHLGDRIAGHFERPPSPWTVDCVDTGVDTPTADRLRAVVRGRGPTVVATYADGLANVDVDALVAFHRGHGRSATVTTVPLPSPYGTLAIDGAGRVTGFREKPRLHDHWINAGFFVFESELFDSVPGGDLEREVLPRLAANGELNAYRHTGFWQSLDTYKDMQALDALATRECEPPWL